MGVMMGYRSIESAHGPLLDSSTMGLKHSQTSLQHFGPVPIPSTHTLSPFLTIPLAFHIRQLIPQRRRRLVSKPVECHQSSLIFILGLSISGSVKFWTKINNKINFFYFFLNRTEPKTGSNQLISVQFFSLPNRFKLKLFQLVHSPKKIPNPYVEEGN
jgi:hypothetical protein